jgi:hypothetical protein
MEAMPGDFYVIHAAGRDEHRGADYYEVAYTGELAVVKDGVLSALYARGHWSALYALEPR